LVELEPTELDPGMNMFRIFMPETKLLLDGEVWLLHEDEAVRVPLEYSLTREPEDV
jgi:hypothetical protein